jgi:hypothetical protein
LVAFYSKHNRLSLSLFTVNPVAIVAEPYAAPMCHSSADALEAAIVAAWVSAKHVIRNRRTGKEAHYECDLEKIQQLNSETKF